MTKIAYQNLKESWEPSWVGLERLRRYRKMYRASLGCKLIAGLGRYLKDRINELHVRKLILDENYHQEDWASTQQQSFGKSRSRAPARRAARCNSNSGTMSCSQIEPFESSWDVKTDVGVKRKQLRNSVFSVLGFLPVFIVFLWELKSTKRFRNFPVRESHKSSSEHLSPCLH